MSIVNIGRSCQWFVGCGLWLFCQCGLGGSWPVLELGMKGKGRLLNVDFARDDGF